jgi:hypothetical protein
MALELRLSVPLVALVLARLAHLGLVQHSYASDHEPPFNAETAGKKKRQARDGVCYTWYPILFLRAILLIT